MSETGVTNPIHESESPDKKEVEEDLSIKLEKELPTSELYFEKDGRKEKEILIFRIKDIPEHILSKWQPKKNEIIRETCVEQYFEEMQQKKTIQELCEFFFSHDFVATRIFRVILIFAVFLQSIV